MCERAHEGWVERDFAGLMIEDVPIVERWMRSRCGGGVLTTLAGGFPCGATADVAAAGGVVSPLLLQG